MDTVMDELKFTRNGLGNTIAKWPDDELLYTGFASRYRLYLEILTITMDYRLYKNNIV